MSGKDEPIRTPKESARLAASIRYHKAVNGALDDLKASSGARSKDYVKSATLFDNYAARIEKLPLTEVDPVLLQYGASVAGKLRAMSMSLRDQGPARGVRQLQVDRLGGRRAGLVGGRGVHEHQRPGDEPKQAELATKLEPERAKIWGVLEGDRSAIRREMFEKYKIDFDQYKR